MRKFWNFDRIAFAVVMVAASVSVAYKHPAAVAKTTQGVKGVFQAAARQLQAWQPSLPVIAVTQARPINRVTMTSPTLNDILTPVDSLAQQLSRTRWPNQNQWPSQTQWPGQKPWASPLLTPNSMRLSNKPPKANHSLKSTIMNLKPRVRSAGHALADRWRNWRQPKRFDMPWEIQTQPCDRPVDPYFRTWPGPTWPGPTSPGPEMH